MFGSVKIVFLLSRGIMLLMVFSLYLEGRAKLEDFPGVLFVQDWSGCMNK